MYIYYIQIQYNILNTQPYVFYNINNSLLEDSVTVLKTIIKATMLAHVASFSIFFSQLLIDMHYLFDMFYSFSIIGNYTR